MSWPPVIFDLRIADTGRKPFRLWLPVFLLWPVVLVLAVVGLVLTVVADVVIWLLGGRFHKYTPLLLGVLGMLTDTRGLTVRVRDQKNTSVDLVVW